jgi:hypothetical protein
VIPHASGMRFIVIDLWPIGSTQQLSASVWNWETKSDMDGDSFVKC